jgi:transcriptional regulator with XRE-family HTH domain
MKHLDIKRALSDHNITQVQLGEKLGLSPQSLTSVIKGNPTVAKLMQIAEGIGCDITDLFYPDPAEEAAEKEKQDREMEQVQEQEIKEAIDYANNISTPLALRLQYLVKKAYPSIKKEEVDELMEFLDPKRLMTADEKSMENADNRTENGNIRTENGNIRTENGNIRTENNMMRAETFCPHCGQKVRVGVVLLPED